MKFAVYMRSYMGSGKIFIYDSIKIYRIFQIDVINALAFIEQIQIRFDDFALYRKQKHIFADSALKILLQKSKTCSFFFKLQINSDFQTSRIETFIDNITKTMKI